MPNARETTNNTADLADRDRPQPARRWRRLRLVLIPLVLIGTLAGLAGTAGAVTDPATGITATTYVYCNPVNHTMQLYTRFPDVTVNMQRTLLVKSSAGSQWFTIESPHFITSGGVTGYSFPALAGTALSAYVGYAFSSPYHTGGYVTGTMAEWPAIYMWSSYYRGWVAASHCFL